MWSFGALWLFCISWFVADAFQDEFVEELLLKPLHSNQQLYAHFHFATKWEDTDLNGESFKHTHLFPRTLGEIIGRLNVAELHLSQTAGLWRYESWGYPVVDAAPGAELWVWFKPGTVNVDENWKELTHSLSGLICASLNYMDGKNSISPEYSFRPSGCIGCKQQLNSSLLRYSSLPREVMCTENLTPWKKLLPNSETGLAALLNSAFIYNTRYNSLVIHLKPVCSNSDCNKQAVVFEQSVSLVYDYGLLGTRNWALPRLFGQGVLGPCPLAKTSTIYVDVSGNKNDGDPFLLTPSPNEYVTSSRGGYTTTYAKYEVPKDHPFSIGATYLEKPIVFPESPPPIHANQYLSGYGQEKGGIVTKIYNNHWGTLDAVLLLNIPWYVPISLHTLDVSSGDRKLEPLALKYVPGKLRELPHHLEMIIRLPARSVTSVSVDFQYLFLKWTEYPPDANHGFYIGSAVVSALLPLARNFTGLPQNGSTIAHSFNASQSGYLVRVRTEVMVITLPTPDFSMPYNVICLACTVVALAFGPLHNITTKRLVLGAKSKETLFVRLKKKVLGVVVNVFNYSGNKTLKKD